MTVSDTSMKVQQLQEGGCSDRIAWSRHGAIAFIRNGSVYLTFMKCKDGHDWNLGSSIEIPSISSMHHGRPIVHVSWNSPGTDIACIDDLGKVSIFTTGPGGASSMSCLHAPQQQAGSQQQHTPQPEELDQIIAFKWLDVGKGILFASPAVLHNSDNNGLGSTNSEPASTSKDSLASYGVFQGQPVGPNHPAQGKYACVALTRRGILRLFVQTATSDLRYYEMSVPLDPHPTGNDTSRNIPADLIFSHASIQGSKEGLLYVSAYQPLTCFLKTYSIAIKWSSSVTGDRQQTAGYNMSEVAHLDIQSICSTSLHPKDPSMSLTHLVSPQPPLSRPKHQQTEPYEYIIYTYFYSRTTKTSVMHMYQLSKNMIPFHPSIYTLGDGNRGADSTQMPTTDINSSKLVYVSATEYDQPVVAVGFGFNDLEFWTAKRDGTLQVEYRGANNSTDSTDNNNNNNNSSNGLLSPSDVGMTFLKVPGNIADICISPTMCSYVYFDENDSNDSNDSNGSNDSTASNSAALKQSFLEFPDSFNNMNSDALAVSFAVVHSISCFCNMCSDDIFCLIKREVSNFPVDSRELFVSTILKECHKAINFTLDIPKEYHIDKVMVNPSLQRLLSLQMSLGMSLDWKSDAMGKLGYTILNLRLLALALTFTLRTASSQQNSPPNVAAELIEVRAANALSLVGLIRWCTDFLALISQELYLMSLQPSISEYLKQDPSKSIYLSMLMCKVLRKLLIYSLRGIKGIEQIAQRLAEQSGLNSANNGSNNAKYAADRVKETISLSVVPLALLDKLLLEVEPAIKNATGSMSGNELLAIEQSLVFYGRIHPSLFPVAESIVSFYSNNVAPSVNMADLYFYDVSWIGIRDSQIDGSPIELSKHDLVIFDAHGKSAKSSSSQIDMLRKQILSESESKSKSDSRLLECVRCGAVTAVDNQTQTGAHWMMAFQKNCYCGGNLVSPLI